MQTLRFEHSCRTSLLSFLKSVYTLQMVGWCHCGDILSFTNIIHSDLRQMVIDSACREANHFASHMFLSSITFVVHLSRHCVVKWCRMFFCRLPVSPAGVNQYNQTSNFEFSSPSIYLTLWSLIYAAAAFRSLALSQKFSYL